MMYQGDYLERSACPTTDELRNGAATTCDKCGCELGPNEGNYLDYGESILCNPCTVEVIS